MHSQKKHTNKLINESSPYLLQHAHNPVDWHAWNEETLSKARKEDKMLLISIGYSACHWCHVMEKESFEDESLAEIMNQNFVCIKVDREERPDVDAVYMNAVQLIHGNGGWPLNCFALPDGKPFYGGTYFQPSQWEVLLKNVADLFKNRRQDLEQQAKEILEGITQENLIKVENDTKDTGKQLLENATKKWKNNFDTVNGGSKGAPKFPMPGAIQFLLEYAHTTNDQDIMKHVELTLDKMMMGGIYDQVGGGFARYSVDAEWKVPHFEKMLYDNAQLITLYTLAFQVTKRVSYLETACETADFVLRELTSDEGAFYSALDADSEGEEGKFYVWTEQEFDKLFGEKSELFKAYFEIEQEAHWEGNKNVLMRKFAPEVFARLKEIDESEFVEQLNHAKQMLYAERSKRVRPGLDDKSLTSWSAMMIKSLVRLSVVADDAKYLEAALKSAKMIIKNNLKDDGLLLHSYKNGKASINGFLEDYAHLADALIELYQVTMDEAWLTQSAGLVQYAVEKYYDEKQGFFWFTSNEATDLVSRKKEIYDNVIPSSNAVMGHALFKLALLTDNKSFAKIVNRMTASISGQVAKYAPSLYCWAQLIHQTSGNFFEVVIAGPDSGNILKEIYRHASTGKIVAGAAQASELLIFKDRFRADKTMIYVCSNNVCRKPVQKVEEALKQMV